MPKLKFILGSLILGSVQFAIFAQDDLMPEREKWRQMQAYFSAEPTQIEKSGKFLSDHSMLIGVLSSIPSAAISGYITWKLLDSLLLSGPQGPNPAIGDLKVILSWLACLIVGVTGGIVGGVTMSKITSSNGEKLENKDGHYYSLLINFLKNWDKYKDQTPKELHPIFESLLDDFSKIDNDRARRVVKTYCLA